MTKAKKTKSKTKVSQTITAKDLKSWLRGAMEFQPQDWTPNAEQWNAIRERIFNLEENESVESYQYSVTEPVYAPVQAFSHGHQHAPVQAYAPVVSTVEQSALGSIPRQTDSGKLAVNTPATDSGVVPVSSHDTVIEGQYSSLFK